MSAEDTMTVRDAVQALHGCEYRQEGSRELFKRMKAAGLVAVFGGSDDLIYFAGAEDDELDAGDGSLFPFTSAGLVRNDCDNDACPYFGAAKRDAVTIVAYFGRNYTTWSYETDIPHETFDVLEDDEVYCRGLVFALADVRPAKDSTQ